MATVLDIIVAGMGRSRQNATTDLATYETELLALINRCLLSYFTLAAKLNPEYVGSIEMVAESAATWARPARAEMVWKVTTAAGVTVAVIPPDDRGMEAGLPAIYRLGRTFFAAGRGNDPTGNLLFYCALRPAPLASTSTALPATWDGTYDELLILDVALYLALKDNRQEELSRLTAEQEKWLALYREFLTHETTAMRRRTAIPSAMAGA